MAAKHDIQLGIKADVKADHDAVVAACRRAAGHLGKHARLQANGAKVTVEILPGLSQTFSHVSPIVGIDLRPAEAGRMHVETRVERYRTSQTMMFGFIPAGAKQLIGRTYFRRFLSALESELGALDSQSGRVQRYVPGVR